MESQIPQSSSASGKAALDSGKYPRAISGFLLQNRADSELFVREAEARQHWLHDHSFGISADLCIDGRVSDFSEALGIPTGLIEMYRSGGAKDSVGSWRYSRLTLDGNCRLEQMPVGGCIKQMAEMRFCVVHYSQSHPEDASCAAWQHDTKTALIALQRHADALNHIYRGYMIAMVTLVDTDLDAVTLIGPKGRICAAKYAHRPPLTVCELRAAIKFRLQKIFPEDWEQIASLPTPFREAFYNELTEHLMANVSFVRRVIEAQRPIELLDHQERLIFVGRPLETREHNAAFLIGDTDNLLMVRRKERFETGLKTLLAEYPGLDMAVVGSVLEMESDFGIALKIVLGNIVRDAVKRDDRNFIVPVLISIPHKTNNERDRMATIHYAVATKRLLKDAVNRLKIALVKRTLKAVDGKGTSGVTPWWLKTELERLEEHVTFCTTVHDRSTRLFMPCD